MNDGSQQSFKEEAGELLADLETSLLELEETPEDPDLIGRVFRSLHTIKGLAAMCGFVAASAFIHQVETVFDRVRGGALPVTRKLVSLSLAALDRIRSMLDEDVADPAGDEAENARVLGALAELLPATDRDPDPLPVTHCEGAPLESYLAVLTEYEISRLRSNVIQGKRLFAMRADFSLDALETDLGEAVEKVKQVGELVSSVPDPERVAPDALAFTLLFASTHPLPVLAEMLGAAPEQISSKGCPGLGSAHPPAPPENREATYRIRFQSSGELLAGSPDVNVLLRGLRRLGACQVSVRTDLAPVDPEDPAALSPVEWDIVLKSEGGETPIRELLCFAELDGGLSVEVTEENGDPKTDAAKDQRLGEILIARGDLTDEELEKGLARQKRIGEILVEDGVVAPSAVEAALAEQKHLRERRERASRDNDGSIRVPTEKLDLLVNLVGELVTVRARLAQLAENTGGSELFAIAEAVEQLTDELRANALSIRMLPIGTTFGMFQRMVRDLSIELGKEVEFVTSGAETELDKTVIERLTDPLLHLIRNCIDHGIEAPEAREAAGKPRKGTVRLAAAQAGDSVLITIEDDGAGLDREAIRESAVRRGLLSPGVELPDQEMFSLIFAPGLSTARTVSNISGRGVGMDVVKRSIDALRGAVAINSSPGKGTGIEVRIPLTMAIVESLLVAIGQERFVVPLALVEECVELTRADIDRTHGNNLADVRGSLIPYISLRKAFGLPEATQDIQQIIVTNLSGRRVGFVVDNVIGEHQTVIKSLGKAFRDVAGISGATILGDGSVALIIDPPPLAGAA